MLEGHAHGEAATPKTADAIILHEQWSFKEWRYITKLLKDPVVGRHASKVYTINTDDAATGLLRGCYTSLPKRNFYPELHRAVPYYLYPNEIVLQYTHRPRPQPKYLATWRGNTTSNSKLRNRLVEICRQRPVFLIETTDSWLNHDATEKSHYVNLLLSGRFSLCPAGLAAVTFRIYESMALGISPVILADEFVFPSGPTWDRFSVQIPERAVKDIESLLEHVSGSYLEMGHRAQEAWEHHFCPEKLAAYYSEALLSCMSTSLGSGSVDQELKRWRSFRTYWTNRWTLPQRLASKLHKLIKL